MSCYVLLTYDSFSLMISYVQRTSRWNWPLLVFCFVDEFWWWWVWATLFDLLLFVNWCRVVSGALEQITRQRLVLIFHQPTAKLSVLSHFGCVTICISQYVSYEINREKSNRICNQIECKSNIKIDVYDVIILIIY